MSDDDGIARVVISITWEKVGDVQKAEVEISGEHDGLQRLVEKLVELAAR